MPSSYSPLQPPLSSYSSSYLSRSPRSNPFSRSGSTGGSGNTPLNRGRAAKDAELGTKKKIPYFFLGSIAAASLLAHKYWPKGFPHGDKEDWELSELALRAKQRRLAEKAARRGGGIRCCSGVSDAEYGYDNWTNPPDGHHEGSLGRGGYHLDKGGGNEEGGYRSCGRDWGRERESGYREPATGRGRSRSRGRYGDSAIPSRRAISRERTGLTERYYPPAPKRHVPDQSASALGSSTACGSRYLLQRSSSSAGSSADSRFLGFSQRGHRDYGGDRPSEVVYVYGGPPARSRRASFDAGVASRCNEGCTWYYR